MIYYIWIVFSLLLSVYGVVFYWPNYTLDDEFILFNDIATIIIFTPSFFVLCFSVLLQVVQMLLKNNNRLKPLAYIAIYFISVIIFSVITVDKWTAVIIILVNIIGSILGVIHHFLSVLIKKLNKINPKSDSY
ncbi:hypothetical protein SAMN04488688_110159 [Paenibacillus sp. cl141a]|nr:hypothetical protein SAMN04488688_110159 [Paenibacillus sp. cl141a]